MSTAVNWRNSSVFGVLAGLRSPSPIRRCGVKQGKRPHANAVKRRK